MGIPLTFALSSIIAFSGGFFIGQYVGQDKSSNDILSVPERADKTADDKTVPVKNVQTFNMEEWLSSAERVSTVISSPPIDDNVPLAIKDGDKNGSESLEAPLSDNELNQIVEGQANSDRESAMLVEQQMRAANLELLEWTLNDMIAAGEPEELIQDMKEDLFGMKAEALLGETEASSEVSVEMTNEDRREELLRSMTSEDIPVEEREQIANDIEGERSIDPPQPNDPPPAPE